MLVKVDRFSFWTPVVFQESLPKKSFLSRLTWRLGSWADQYAYAGKKQINVKVEPCQAHQFSFKKKEEKAIPMWKTLIKMSTYVLSLFILPLFTIPIKMLYKKQVNSHISITPSVKTSSHSTLDTSTKISAIPVSTPAENTVSAKILPNLVTHLPSPNKIIAEKIIGKTKLVLISGDLLKEPADVIVNAAQTSLAAGGGICGQFYSRAGESIFTECKEILKKQACHSIACGEAVLTSAGKLNSGVKAIIHTPGPDCRIKDQNKDREDLLFKAYTNSLELASNPQAQQKNTSSTLKIQSLYSIGFPGISMGIYEYPANEAFEVALKAVKIFIKKHPDTSLSEIRFVFLPLEKDSKSPLSIVKEVFEKLD